MPWVRLEDTFPEHPKIESIGPLGLALHIRALCYCARNLTDGRIPLSVVRKMLVDFPSENGSSPGLAGLLVSAGVWKENEHNDGFIIHDYLDYQPSRKEVLRLRTLRQLSGKQGGIAKAKQTASKLLGGCSSKTLPRPDPIPIPEDQDPNPLCVLTPNAPCDAPPKKTPKPRKERKPYTPFFESWWKEYPNEDGSRVGKSEAFTEWTIQGLEAKGQEMVDCLRRYDQEDRWRKVNGHRCILNPRTFLHQRRWEDLGVA